MRELDKRRLICYPEYNPLILTQIYSHTGQYYVQNSDICHRYLHPGNHRSGGDELGGIHFSDEIRFQPVENHRPSVAACQGQVTSELATGFFTRDTYHFVVPGQDVP